MKDLFGLDETSRVLQFASMSWDTSAEEIYPCLTSGGTLVLRTEAMLDPAVLVETCKREHLTMLDLPTAYFRQFVETISLLGIPPSLRVVIIGGERASRDDVNLWNRVVDNTVRLLNTYGATELTAVVTALEMSSIVPARAVPIGRPVANARAYILDTWDQPLPIGTVGRLHIGGVPVARGYLNNPVSTAERFVPDPFSSEPGRRLYDTGDLARYLRDGLIELLGRSDHQIKIRGFRIELGEIESALRSQDGVRDVVVLAREDTPGDKRLVAYVVGIVDVTEVRRRLNEQLPEYMVPSAFVVLEALPVTPNGKVDRRALPAPERGANEATYLAPRNAMEEALARIWSEVLKVDRVGVHDNFFELGGHSLLATRVLVRLRKELNVDLAVRDIFECPTIARLANRIAESAPVERF
jgi:acyl-coenzyme A synthetase/AMP-(fatty) acid ligase/acyl carrier protein